MSHNRKEHSDRYYGPLFPGLSKKNHSGGLINDSASDFLKDQIDRLNQELVKPRITEESETQDKLNTDNEN